MIELLGNRLRKLRENKGLSQRELSGQLGCGITNKQISYWEKGEREIRLNDLVTIARYFGVTTDYLLGLSAYPNHEMQSSDRESDLTMEICNSVYEYDRWAIQTVDYLFSGIKKAIIAWEYEAHTATAQESGIQMLIMYAIVLFDCVRRNNTPGWNKELRLENELRLTRLLDGLREYIAVIVERDFKNCELAERIRGRIEEHSMEHEILNMFESVWRE